MVHYYWRAGDTLRRRQLSNHWLEICRRSFPASAVFPQSLAYGVPAFEAYAGSEKLAQLVREIGWGHNLVILQRCSDPLEREFYVRMTRRYEYSSNEDTEVYGLAIFYLKLLFIGENK
ncbi:DUF1016 N-terminal domain-containing protein [Methanoculleus bovis]